MGKNQNRFFYLFGVGVAGWRCRIFLFLNTAIGFFFVYIFYSVKFGTFLTIWQKAPFWLVEIQKVLEILYFGILTGGSRICSCVPQGPAWCLVRQGFGRNFA
jgi:hypothetical protein